MKKKAFKKCTKQKPNFLFKKHQNRNNKKKDFGSGDGQSFLFGMLVGPIFTIPYCLGLAPTGWLADRYNKVKRTSVFR